MAIVIAQYVTSGTCDDSPNEILNLLGGIKESEGKPINGLMTAFNTNKLEKGFTDGRVYIINDESIDVPTLTVFFRGIFTEEDFDKNELPSKMIGDSITNTLADLFIRLGVTSDKDVESFTTRDGSFAYSIKGDLAPFKNDLHRLIRQKVKIVKA